MECTTGVRTAPMGARWTWNTLADSACSHHIPSLAPAVALPAPRHDRRRTGAAGSPPGGFPFVEFRRAVVKCAAGREEPQKRLSFYRWRTNSAHSRPRLREGKLQRESRPRSDCGDERKREFRDTTEQIETCPREPSLDSGNPLCYRTEPLRGLRRRHSGRI